MIRRGGVGDGRGRLVTAAVLVALGLTGAAPLAHAGGFHISILGVRRTGMMTVLGNPDDVTALFHNPAGLADLKGTQLHLSSGLTLLGNKAKLQALDPVRFPELHPAGCGEPGAPACPWPVGADGYYEASFKPESYVGIVPYLGASHNLGAWSPRLKNLVVSLAAYAPGAYGAALGDDKPTSYYIIDGLFVVIATTAGLGWRINDHIAVGASFSYNYMRLGYAQRLSTTDVFTAPGEEPDSVATMAQGLLGDLRLDYTGTDHGVGWGVGTLITPWPWLTVGLSYGGWTAARFDGGVTVGATRLADPADLTGLAAGMGYKLPHRLQVDMPIPPALNAGINLKPSANWEIGLDFRLWLYSLFKEQRIVPIYDPAQPGTEPMSEESLSHDKNYSQSYEIAAGVLARPFSRLRELELMAGIAFDKSPVPDETFSLDNPSMNQIVCSVGARLTLRSRWRLGAAYMLINYLERDITTSQSSPPVNVRISAISHIPTVEMEYLF